MRRTNASMDGEKNTKQACFNFIKQMSEKKTYKSNGRKRLEGSPPPQNENIAPKCDKNTLIKHKLHLLGILKTNPTDKYPSQRAALTNLLYQQQMSTTNANLEYTMTSISAKENKDERKLKNKGITVSIKSDLSSNSSKLFSHLKSLRHLKTYLGEQKPKTPRGIIDHSSDFVIQKKDSITSRMSKNSREISRKHSVKEHQEAQKTSGLIKEFRDEDFEIGDMIGKGRFGSVYLARSIATELILAMKVMNKNAMMKYRASKQLVREIRIHSMLDHPNIIKSYGVLQNADEVYLLMEYAPYGNLFSKLRKMGKFDEKTVVNYTTQIINAFNYLQSKQILHRDLKPENILISFDDQLKLADFGWAIQLPGKATMRQTFCGTLDYISPEMAQGEYYGLHTDNWSIGILVFELLTGELPFIRAGPYDLFSNPKFSDISYPDYLSDGAKDFISRLLAQDPLKRMTLPEALRHPFLAATYSR